MELKKKKMQRVSILLFNMNYRLKAIELFMEKEWMFYVRQLNLNGFGTTVHEIGTSEK